MNWRQPRRHVTRAVEILSCDVTALGLAVLIFMGRRLSIDLRRTHFHDEASPQSEWPFVRLRHRPLYPAPVRLERRTRAAWPQIRLRHGAVRSLHGDSSRASCALLCDARTRRWAGR